MRRSLAAWFVLIGVALAQREPQQPGCACTSEQAARANETALAAHVKRRLDEASAAYDETLGHEPARETNAEERDLLIRFAPRLYVTATEPFPLQDFAAILHPAKPWIAYHLFWEDDIDFPDDNDPCDHEVVWVRLDVARRRVAAYYTYFHGRILRAPDAAIDDAARNHGRVAVEVQWGKHGSMPPGWAKLPIRWDQGDVERAYMPKQKEVRLEEYQRATYTKLSTEGRRAQNSPLGRGWPLRFTGSWEDFSRFPRLVDPAGLLRKKQMMRVSCWNHAVLNRHLIRYNISAKVEWPRAICDDEPAAPDQRR